MIKSKNIFFVVLISCIIICIFCAYYPIYNFYTDKTIEELPPYNTYQTALRTKLTSKFKAGIKTFNCKGISLPIKVVEGDSQGLPNLINDIHLAVSSTSELKLQVDSLIMDKMSLRNDELLKKWEGILTGNEIMNIAIKSQEADFKTKYSLMASVNKIGGYSDNSGNNMILIVTLNDEISHSRVFDVAVTFIHPQTLTGLENKIECQKKYIATLKKNANLSIKILIITLSITGFLFLVLIIISLIKRKKEIKRMNHFLSEIEKREELVQNGHYVVAYELVNNFLHYFPDNSKILAFRERLIDFTNNDPKKAQLAYVESKKIQKRITEFNTGISCNLITNDEKKNISGLVQYNSDLKKLYNEALLLEEKQKKERILIPKINEINILLSKNMLITSEQKLNNLFFHNSSNEVLLNIKGKVNERINLYKEKVGRIIKLLSEGNIYNAKILLKETEKICKDSHELKTISDNINDLYINKIIFTLNDEFKIEVFLEKKITIGRKDGEEEPDICFEDRRVSRKHAAIYISQDKVFIDDYNSTGGTYINGEKLNSSQVHNDQIITIAKIIDYKVSIMESDKHIINGLMMQSDKDAYILLQDKFFFGISGEFITLSNDGFKIFKRNGCIWGSYNGIPVFFKKQKKITIGNSTLSWVVI